MTDSPQPAGWYQAEGDPPGTQRYWDGAQWQGGPQPVSTEPQGFGGVGAATMATSVGVPAEFGQRVIAYLIDYGIVLAGYILAVILGAILGVVSEGLGTLVLIVGMIGAIGVGLWNVIVRQGQTGQSIGKQQQGIKLVSDKTGQPVGGGMAFARIVVAWAISTFTCGLGGLADLLWPLFDSEKKRLTDKALNFSVVNV